MITTAALSFSAGVVMFILLRTHRTYPGFGWWTLGVALIALGSSAYGLRAAYPSWPSLLVPAVLLVAGYQMILRGMCIFHERPLRPRLEWAVMLSFLLVFAFYCVDAEQAGARIAVFSLYAGGLNLATALATLDRHGKRPGANELLFAVWMALMGVFNLFRVWHAAWGPAIGALWMQASGFQSFYVLTQVLTVQLATLALIGINANRIERDYLVLQEQLRMQSIHDPLTGLFNRRYLDDTLTQEIHRCQRDGQPLCVAMLDLDHFKHFNDAYGHEAGDDVLRALGLLFTQWARTSDMVCRYGGEEFTIILRDTTLDQVLPRLNELRERIAQAPIVSEGRQLPSLTISIGVTQLDAQVANPVAILNRADTALYHAKQNGRNRVERA